MSENYDFREIEPRWQRHWEQGRTFRAANPGEPGGEKPKYYVLDMFPYPSGAGLHIGHPEGYTATDIVARYMRMRGHNVLHPMGWDAFGLPAEQYAVEHNVHPRETTKKNIETFKRQLKAIGFSYDWGREFATTDEDYYRWTQWIFLKIYNSWYDPEWRWTDAVGRQNVGAARPIETLPIPPHVKEEGPRAVEAYQADHRLAYLAEVPVNWCPALGTVLANEEVTNEGRSERGNHPVYRRPMKQWMMRITEYADRLLADLDHLDWPESTKLGQRNWIGRSEGAYIDFTLVDEDDRTNGNVIRVFSTRPDTIYGATYLVLAPEHRLVSIITTDAQRDAVNRYIEQAKQKSDLDRTAATKTKTGVFTGGHAINPANRARVPIWIGDYVLMQYGTGSIMGVPGSDKRDLEFAETYELPIIQVVAPPAGTDWRGFEDDGAAVNSPAPHVGGERFEGQCDLNGLPTPAAKRKMIEWLEARDLGEGTVQYKLRDWLFSRQRYWGEPFPILYHADGRAVALHETELPLRLPDLEDFRPQAGADPHADPQTPLSRAKDWTTAQRGGETLKRELNTMPNWAGSCWYYLRFLDPRNAKTFAEPSVERYWMSAKNADGSPRFGGVDLYVGGNEHAVLHLLYARFWHKVLYDLGYVSTPEPFQKLFHQGMILSYAYRDARGVYIHYDDIDFREDGAYYKETGEKLSASVEKMSKTLKNVVNPDQIIAEYGADTLRLYEMYMGPLEASKPWNSRDIVGAHRFLHRVWRLVVAPLETADAGETPAAGAGWRLNPKIVAERAPELERLLHKTIKKVGHDLERFGFNTAIAALIGFVNEATGAKSIGRDQLERFLLLLAPFAPHVAEELWQRLRHAQSLAYEPWPTFDESLTRDETVEMAVQVNGKLRARFTVAADATEDQVRAAALAQESVAREVAGRPIKKAIVVKGRLVNFIV